MPIVDKGVERRRNLGDTCRLEAIDIIEFRKVILFPLGIAMDHLVLEEKLLIRQDIERDLKT